MNKINNLIYNFTIIISILILTSLFNTTIAADFFDETFGDMPEEVNNAQENDKKGIFIFFHMEECPFCDKMKNDVFSVPKVQKFYRDNFLVYQLDKDSSEPMIDFDGKENSIKYFADKKYKVRATPLMLFFDRQGNLVTKYTGPTRNTEEFMLLGKYVADKEYTKQRFTKYKRQANNKPK